MDILEAIGRTPLLELPSLSALANGCRILPKAEFCIPCGGSIKARTAKAMILAAEKAGALSTAGDLVV